jgi:PAS domain S-box-containing protein
MAVIQSMQVGGWTELHARILDGDSVYHRFFIKLCHYIDPEEETARWLGLAIDADEVRRPDAREDPASEKRFRLALETAGMAVWDWNITTGEMVWNDWANLLPSASQRPEKLTPDYFFRLIHEDDRAGVRETMDQALSRMSVFHTEFRIVRDDMERWVCASGCVTDRLNSNGLDLVGILYDITSIKRHERQKDEFIGIASHELRTPVTSIKAYGQLLQRQLSDSPSTEEEALIVDRLVYQADRLSQLVRQLLDTTRISEHQLVLDRTWFEWDALVQRCIEAVGAADSTHTIDFVKGATGKVYADQELIQQALLNLLSNAMKFSDAGMPIVTGTWRNGDSVGFSVKDQGIGIPETMIESIFEPFVQARHHSATARSGLGLGLYITAGIIRRHGGDIGVQSKPAEGAQFYFTIPAEPQKDSR